MSSDPLASIRSWPIAITLAESEFVIPPQSAAAWLVVLMEERIQTLDLVPGMLRPDDQQEVIDLLAEGRIDLKEINEVCLEVIRSASGRDWWWTMRMLAVLADMWPALFGQMADMDLERVPLGAFLDRAYFTCIQHMPEDKRKLFDLELEAVPEGVEVELDEDAESRAFLQMMQQAQQF